jgi:hypothetical protein
MIALPAVAHGFARREEARAEKTSTAECSFVAVPVEDKAVVNAIAPELATLVTQIALETFQMPGSIGGAHIAGADRRVADATNLRTTCRDMRPRKSGDRNDSKGLASDVSRHGELERWLIIH